MFWGFLTWTGLTGVLHRPDRCKDYSVEVASRDRSDQW
jgi:hypothetical protein